jgi:hypothetical protein
MDAVTWPKTTVPLARINKTAKKHPIGLAPIFDTTS